MSLFARNIDTQQARGKLEAIDWDCQAARVRTLTNPMVHIEILVEFMDVPLQELANHHVLSMLLRNQKNMNYVLIYPIFFSKCIEPTFTRKVNRDQTSQHIMSSMWFTLVGKRV